MKNLKAIFLFLLAGLLITGCNKDEEKAKARLDVAREYMQKQEYAAARAEIDSIRILYPKALSILKESQGLGWEIESKELERSISYLDSMMVVYQEKADSIRKDLLVEKNEEYQTEAIYMDKNQTLEKTMGTTCLRFYVNERGDMTAMAVASGAGKGSFTAVRAETPSGIYGETPEIYKEDSNNFNGELSQTLTFSRGKDNGFIEFLYTYREEPLKISFLGSGKPYVYTFGNNERKALASVYELSFALTNINQLKKERKLTEAKLKFAKDAIVKSNIPKNKNN
ncbi:MAG: hypothetical protein LUG18_00025 [Candidatus Azobacteroides sp.]|nr:hypothetical protein [Candidatus Azobacteroides sp.]